MKAVFVSAGVAGFVLAIAGVPAIVFATAAVMLTVGFIAGYITAHRELRLSEEEQFDAVREVYLDFPQRVVKHRDDLALHGVIVTTTEEIEGRPS